MIAYSPYRTTWGSAPSAPLAPIDRPLGPVTAPVIAPPASPISGSPTQVSIFQPADTTATILQQAASPTGYQEPQPSFNIGATVPVVGSVALSAAPSSGFSFSLDGNTILLLLLLLAFILVVL